eukprot:6754260-Prymnesium_polylepis.2
MTRVPTETVSIQDPRVTDTNSPDDTSRKDTRKRLQSKSASVHMKRERGRVPTQDASKAK